VRVFVKRGGLYTGIDPGDKVHRVYADRRAPGAWEEVELTQDGHVFRARYVAADRVLAITPDGLESRPAGTAGAWESLHATTQPDGTHFLYRTEHGAIVEPVLTIEVA
jgi:hypothetical protein